MKLSPVPLRWLPLIVALVAPKGAEAQATDAFDGIPNVTFRFYDVTGRDPAAIRRSIDARRPVDPANPKGAFDGATTWSMRWRWRGDGKGGCDLSTVEISYAVTVTLPRLTGEVPTAVRASWDRYLAALEMHEAGHARYAYDHRGEVMAAMQAATCATASEAAKATLKRLVAHDDAYDVETQHGKTQGAVFPPR